MEWISQPIHLSFSSSHPLILSKLQCDPISLLPFYVSFFFFLFFRLLFSSVLVFLWLHKSSIDGHSVCTRSVFLHKQTRDPLCPCSCPALDFIYSYATLPYLALPLPCPTLPYPPLPSPTLPCPPSSSFLKQPRFANILKPPRKSPPSAIPNQSNLPNISFNPAKPNRA